MTPQTIHGQHPSSSFEGSNHQSSGTRYSDRDVEAIECLARMAHRDEGALQQLHQKFHSIVLSVGRRILPDPSDAEEVAADTFIQAWNRAAEYKPELGSPTAWLAVITRNRAIDRLRSLSRRRVEDNMDEFFDLASPLLGSEQCSIQKERAAAVRRAMKELPERQYRALELAYLQGMTHSEIAAYSGIPLGSAKTLLRQAIGNLRKVIGL